MGMGETDNPLKLLIAEHQETFNQKLSYRRLLPLFVSKRP